MKPTVHAENHEYQKHLAKTRTPEFEALGARVRNTFASPAGERGQASDADLAAYAQWEMQEAMWWLEPCVAVRDQDGFHASCCIMRANAAIDVLKRRAAA